MSRYTPTAVAILCTLAAAAAAQERPRKPVAPPRPAKWQDVARNTFDPRWILPQRRVDTSLPLDERPTDLVAEMQRFVTTEFPATKGEEPAAHTLSVGNLLRALARLETDDERRELLEELRRKRPRVHRRVRSTLPDLVLDAGLYGDEWDPDEDLPDDGVLHVDPVRRDLGPSRHWKGLSGDEMIHQAVVFIRADTAAIKAAENDYAAYPDNVGAAYEEIYAVRGSYVGGDDPAGRPFSALQLFFQCDLPFPFGGYTCDLRILNQVGADGLLRTHVYSPSKDFHWLAGQDVYLPVKTTDGESAGTLLVRLYGFDIDDVPEGESARRSALRGSLGNLKRRAEAVFTKRGGETTARNEVLPAFPVRGLGPR